MIARIKVTLLITICSMVSFGQDSMSVSINVEILEKLFMESTVPENCKPPVDGCRAHFSGVIMGDKGSVRCVTQIFESDKQSEYIGAGEYPNCMEAFPKAIASSFDAVAIDEGTRVIIYSQPNFQGDTLFDQTGPILITNGWLLQYNKPLHTAYYRNSELQRKFPPSRRVWSKENMYAWQLGSMKILKAK